MKPHPRVTALLVALAVLLAALGALCGAVVRVATDESFYLDDSRRAVAVYLGREPGPELTEEDEAAVTRYVRLTREEQRHAASLLAADMRVQYADFGDLDLLNERERQHLCDVRDLVWHARRLSGALVALAAAFAVAAAWTCAGHKRRARPALLGALCGAGALTLLALALLLAMRFGGFAGLFVGMHRLLFTNDLWLMDPSTDLLIRMMPQPLFEAALSRVLAEALGALAVILAMLAALYGLIGGMIDKNLIVKTKEDGAEKHDRSR